MVKSKNEYFFNRCRHCFEAILYYYQNRGVLTLPQDIPMMEFEKEVLFFELGEEVLRELKIEEKYIVEKDEDGDKEAPIDDNGKLVFERNVQLHSISLYFSIL